MAEVSYIKQNKPKTYAFFVEYWGFVKKFWVIEKDEEWWNVFISDLAYYVTKYEHNDYFVELIMQMYIRNQEPWNCRDTIGELATFLKEWWQYVNAYYETDSEDPEWWDNFKYQTKELLHKYGGNEFYCNLIDIFVKFKASEAA